MTRKINFFIRRLQFQRSIPGFLENLCCLTLSNSKISEGVSSVFKKMTKVERAEAKFVFQRLRKTVYISSTVPKVVLYCGSGTLLCFRPLILFILCFFKS